METWWLVAGLGLFSGVLFAASRRVPLLGWVCLSPLGLAILAGLPLQAALAGALVGALGSFPSARSPVLRPLLAMTVVPSVLNWSLLAGVSAWLQRGQPAALLLITLPIATVISALPLRAAGAPRWTNNPLACSQEPWLMVVHIARLGGDLVVSAMLALAAAALAVLWAGGTDTLPAIGAALGVVLAALAFGAWSLRSARARVAECECLRVAALVDDADTEGVDGLVPMRAPEYRDVAATVRRYQRLVEQAAAQAARLLVLPEVCVLVDDAGRQQWLDAVSGWARAHQLSIVAPFFYAGDAPKNELVLIDARGIVASYEKQHPGPRIEPPRQLRTPIGPHATNAGFCVSTVICVDLDYTDLVAPARRGGGILAVPANDWFDGFEQFHHRTAVWAAVTTGLSVVRATGHGISSIYDGVGRVIAQRSSAAGPGLLLADAPLALPQR